MGRAALILGVMLAFQVSPPRRWADQQKSTQKTAVVIDQQSADEKKDTAKTNSKKPPEKPPWWDVAWSTIALTVIGVVTAIIALCTLRDIKRQTKNAENAAIAARDSANAALLNAKATVNAERAWIDGEIIEAKYNAPTADQVREQIMGKNLSQEPDFTIQVVNRGRTPARIAQWKLLIDFEFSRIENGEALYSKDRALHLLMGTNKPEFLETFDLQPHIDQWESAGEEKKSIIVKVIVEYFDIISGDETLHETSFVYVYSPSGVLDRTSRFNRYT